MAELNVSFTDRGAISEPVPLTSPSSHRESGLLRRAWNHRYAPHLWFLLVTVLSFLPGPIKGHLYTRSAFHIPAHACVFAISALMVCRNVRTGRGRIIAAIAVAVYGCTIEALQAWIFNGPVEWDDMATDICGILAAILLATYANTLRKENPDLL